jgi:Helix-turn-helix domain
MTDEDGWETQDEWRKLGDDVAARRRELKIATQQELADRAGVSVATITRLEGGRPLRRRSWTWAEVERALDWPAGYIERYMRGLTSSPQTVYGGSGVSIADMNKLEERARTLVKNALIETLPNVKVSEMLAAEEAIIQSLKAGRFLPSVLE